MVIICSVSLQIHFDKETMLKRKSTKQTCFQTNTGQGKTPVCRILATDSQNNSRVSYIAFWSVDLSYTLSMSDDETCLLPPSCTEISRPTSIHFIPHLPCCSLLPEIPPTFKTFLQLPCKPVEIVRVKICVQLCDCLQFDEGDWENI